MEKATISMSPAAQARAYQMAQRKKEKMAARKKRKQTAIEREEIRSYVRILLSNGSPPDPEIELKPISSKAKKRRRQEIESEKEFRKLVDSIEFEA